MRCSSLILGAALSSTPDVAAGRRLPAVRDGLQSPHSANWSRFTRAGGDERRMSATLRSRPGGRS